MLKKWILKTLAEIYGFELEDGLVQISILDYYIMPSQETMQ